MRAFYPLGLCALLSTGPAWGQPAFTDRPDLLPLATHSAVCMGVTDMNGDGRDDLGVLDGSNHFRVFYQNPDGRFVAYDYGLMEGSQEWGMALADMDQDGHKDVLSGSFQMNYLRIAVPGQAQPVSILDNSGFFVQCVSIGDMDNDGWLDGFACNDNGAPGTWRNDQSGALTYAALVDFATNPASDMSGNYGSVFTDFDLDGDIDFYLAHCRQGVNDPNDPRRWDRLFVNDGTGHFTDEATVRGVQNNWQTWAADFGDWDNDGDLDLVTVNHDRDVQFLENDGTGHFTEIDDGGLNLTGFLLEVHMEDFDNDGFLDILIGGGSQFYLQGHGDGTFTRRNGLFPSDKAIQGFALGDLNNDGAMDVWASYGDGYTSPDPARPDRLWLNNGNANHWLNVRLRGVQSNRDAIGAHVTLTTALGTQVREVRAGESYGMTNTAMCHFGLGANTTIPALTVRWPSGQVDTYTDVAADQAITLVEGGCNAPAVTITSSTGAFNLCGGTSSITLTASGAGPYLWSTGATTASIDVDQPGQYTVDMGSGGCTGTAATLVAATSVPVAVALSGDNNLCPGEEVTLTASGTGPYLWSTGATGASINVDQAGQYTVETPGDPCFTPGTVTITADVTVPTVTLSGRNTLCPGEEVTLTASTANAYAWSTGATTQSIMVSEAGSYTVTVDNSCPGVVSAPVDVEMLSAPEAPTSADVSIPAPGTAELVASDIGVVWYDVAEGGSPIGTGSPWTTPFVDSDATFWCAVPGPTSLETAYGGISFINPNASEENDDGYYPLFTATAPFTLVSVKVHAGAAGDRVIALVDGPSGTVISQATHSLPAGESRVQLDLSIAPGAYGLRVIGTPGLTWENTNGYPFALGAVGEITGVRTPGGGTSTNFWEDFYDWEIEVGTRGCESARTPVQVLVGPTAITEAGAGDGLAVYPNPAHGAVNIALGTLAGTVDLDLLDVTGRVVRTERTAAGTVHRMDVSALSPGGYSLRVRCAGGTLVKRIVVN
ncbi:MAG: VCBS repeat-containing protein [Bacteroidetes bacterium]|nr:VCBS repeat-containing protein [Bacteroidota bacterium]